MKKSLILLLASIAICAKAASSTNNPIYTVLSSNQIVALIDSKLSTYQPTNFYEFNLSSNYILLSPNAQRHLMPVPMLGYSTYAPYSWNIGTLVEGVPDPLGDTNWMDQTEILLMANNWKTNGMFDAGYNWIWIGNGWNTNRAVNRMTIDPFPDVSPYYTNGLSYTISNLHALGYKVGAVVTHGSGYPYTFQPHIHWSRLSNDLYTAISWGLDGINFIGEYEGPRPAWLNPDEAGAIAVANILSQIKSNVVFIPNLEEAQYDPTWSPFGDQFFDSAPIWQSGSFAEADYNLHQTLSRDDVLGQFWKYRNQTRQGRTFHLLYIQTASDSYYNQSFSFKSQTNTMNILALWPSSVLAGVGYWTEGEETLVGMLTNREWLDIVLDKAMLPGTEIYSNSLQRIWVRPLGFDNTKIAIGFLNGEITNPATTTLTFYATNIGWPMGTVMSPRNPWTRTTLPDVTNSFSSTVSTNDSSLYILKRTPVF